MASSRCGGPSRDKSPSRQIQKFIIFAIHSIRTFSDIETLVISDIRHLMYSIADSPNDCTVMHLMQWCTFG